MIADKSFSETETHTKTKKWEETYHVSSYETR
jgi:hypothetical protein